VPSGCRSGGRIWGRVERPEDVPLRVISSQSEGFRLEIEEVKEVVGGEWGT